MEEIGNKEIKIEIAPLNPMIFHPTFAHIVEEIFDQFDKENLRSFREVSKLWLDVIDNQNLFWNKTVKHEEGNKAFQFACKNGISKILGMIFQKHTDFKVDYNARDRQGWTGFHCASQKGHSKITEIIIQKSTEFNIELNTKDHQGMNAFHTACQYGHSKIA